MTLAVISIVVIVIVIACGRMEEHTVINISNLSGGHRKRMATSEQSRAEDKKHT